MHSAESTEAMLDRLSLHSDEALDQDDVQGEKKDGDNGYIALRQTVGIPGGVSLIVGTIIGSGIFASPKYLLEKCRSVGLSLVVWLACGVMSVFGSLSYCELGTMIPRSGGEYAYLHEAFGPLPAFMFSWTSVVVLMPSSLAISMMVFGSYVLEPIFPGCSGREDLVHLVKLIAATGIGIITAVNCASVKMATRMQIVFTLAKLVAIIMIIITGIVKLFEGYTQGFVDPFANSETSISTIGLAFYDGFWAYAGWNNLNYNTEEVKNPSRTLPISILVGIPVVIACYMMVNVAYFATLSVREILDSGAVAVTLAERFYGVMAWCIPVFVAFSVFGSANGGAFSAGRLTFVSARQGHMPRVLAMIHTERRTPLVALLFQSLMAMVMLTPESSNFQSLVNYFSFATWVAYGATMVGLIVLRYTKPDLPRPVKVWIIFPILTLLSSVYLVVAPIASDPLPCAMSMLFIASSIPVYLIFIKFKLAPKWFHNAFDWLTWKTQLILNVCFPNSESEIAAE